MRTFDDAVNVAQRCTAFLGGDHPDAVKAIARVCDLAITSGIWGAVPYVLRPRELPDTDAELNDAATSTKAVDRELKMSVLRWKWANETVEVENAERLRVCALNFVDLEPLRKMGDEDARTMQETLFVHCKRAWAVDISTAPNGPTLERWCRRTVATKNPVPIWLRTGSAPRSAWKPRGGEMTQLSGLFSNSTKGK